jgi:hypothetical protein
MHTMHLLPMVAIQPNLELKTRPKQLLGSLPLVIALPRMSEVKLIWHEDPFHVIWSKNTLPTDNLPTMRAL